MSDLFVFDAFQTIYRWVFIIQRALRHCLMTINAFSYVQAINFHEINLSLNLIIINYQFLRNLITVIFNCQLLNWRKKKCEKQKNNHWINFWTLLTALIFISTLLFPV